MKSCVLICTCAESREVECPLQTGSLTVPGARLAINKPQPSSSAYHNAMATDIPMIMPRLFYMGTEIWTQFLMLAWTLTH